MGTLDGKVAVVTGGSRGIGKGAALELAAAGATVYVTARSVKEGDAALPGTVGQTVQEIEALGGQAIAVACDVRDDDALGALFEGVDKEQGRLDVLVNSAFYDPGMDAGKPFWETSGNSRFDTKGAESQRFVGRGIVALASDPELMKRSGKPFTSRELADAYGFTDVDGNLPDGSPPPLRK